MIPLSTTQAAARLGVTPNHFRALASRARSRGDEWRLPRGQWPDGRTPMWDAERIVSSTYIAGQNKDREAP